MWTDKEDQIIFDDIGDALISYLFFNNSLLVTFDLCEKKDQARQYFKIISSKEFPDDFIMVSYRLTQEGIDHLKSFGKQRILEINPPYYNFQKAIKESDL
jgi:hypothetical protein